MTDQMQRFLKLVSENSDVKKEFEQINVSAAKELAEGIIALAKAHDITLTAEDLETNVGEDLADDELDQVAGGWIYDDGFQCPKPGIIIDFGSGEIYQ